MALGLSAQHVEQIRVVVSPEHVQRPRSAAPDGHHGAGVLLARRYGDRSPSGVVTGGAVGQAERLPVLGQQVGRVAGWDAGSDRVLTDNLARVRVIGGDDYQRVGIVALV